MIFMTPSILFELMIGLWLLIKGTTLRQPNAGEGADVQK
jgi:hypothetical protein